MADQDVNIKITAKDTAKAELASLRKEFLGLQKAARDASDPARLKELERAMGHVTARTKDAQAALRKANIELAEAERRSKGLARVWNSAGNAIEKNATTIRNAGLVVAASLAYFSRGALMSFSQVEDASSALKATFGNTGQQMIDWAQKSGDALNLSQGEARDALLSFSGYAKTAGLEGEKLATFSQDLVARSADLASYYGGTTADALQALGAALRGEAEPARRYQVFVDDMALKAEFFNITGKKVTGTLTAQQKVLAAHSLILKQTTTAQGDMERTQDSTANTLKDTSQQWSDMQAAMGETVATGAGPLLRILNSLFGVVAKLPDPVKVVGLGVLAIGAAAAIATPKIVALNDALVSRGGLVGVTKANWKKAAVGIGFVTAAYTAMNAAKDSDGNVFSEDNIYNEYGAEGYALALRDIVQPGAGGSVVNVLTGITDALVPHNTYLDDARSKVTELDSSLTKLVADGHADQAARKFDDITKSASMWGGSVDDVKVILPGYTAALDAAGEAAREAAEKTSHLSRAQRRAEETTKALDKALDHLDETLARRQAVKDYNTALVAFKKKPSADSGESLDSAMSNAARAFKDPKRRAQFVTGAVEEIRTAVNNTSLSSGIKSNIKQPLNESYNEAQKLLGTLRRIAAMEAAIRAVKIVAPGAVTAFRADGGLVSGPDRGRRTASQRACRMGSMSSAPPP